MIIKYAPALWYRHNVLCNVVSTRNFSNEFFSIVREAVVCSLYFFRIGFSPYPVQFHIFDWLVYLGEHFSDNFILVNK